MKKFKFTIRGNIYDVELLNIEDNIAEIEVNGSKYEVELHQEVKTTKTPKLTRSVAVPTGESDKAKTHKPSAKQGAGFIKAPLPGTILEVKIKVGDKINVDDTLLIMEAMKMENNIKADRSGTVKEIKVNNGDSVLEGDLLVEIGD
ncbi:MAG: acetyl-CoA carboxylase biotin carboxyl carrier protein subunit [Melioribacteraceae bacterium]|nr:acetyl-CoA carboxylase biotin carboxyl carrier protein subunit [Melioribacteraceae bacterium]MCF8354058.1 acetyl-CoA carboxylase biotin carboxyl carrier protein subunit [Melioribacteraceae bacterium]MCF8393731.1 acetyl-CoA carboxylase biotin carboxyl carrier protein subunit [Melioribacteraceae bacterium]MCF8417755.1 acetyl-CoA carboxylase biotin carboxyl carrier protein subunit [Melioribacteraceae bacterium]